MSYEELQRGTGRGPETVRKRTGKSRGGKRSERRPCKKGQGRLRELQEERRREERGMGGTGPTGAC